MPLAGAILGGPQSETSRDLEKKHPDLRHIGHHPVRLSIFSTSMFGSDVQSKTRPRTLDIAVVDNPKVMGVPLNDAPCGTVKA